MKLIVCIDENKGMMFNHRRQSRDRILLEDLAKEIGESTLYVSAYSEQLLLQAGITCTVSDSPLADAKEDDCCLIEDLPVFPFADRIDEVILYHWNRHYPADVYFDLDLTPFHLADCSEFAGFSHDKITKERWKR